ncbi:MAG TPA: SDR family NAD(P)-dependent oxidoreductase, partial [Micromonosporaceae bacterium]|nr:SDR family NAD(P)-dependent oxidoreductase [Micromonosporaceae bacterium]
GEHGVPAAALAADLSTDEGCGLVEERLRATGEPVDLLVNNAGITLGRSFLRSDVDDLTRLLRVNVQAVLRLTAAAVPGMVRRRHGAVVNVSSVAGFGTPMPGSTYPASKAWVTSFSQSVGLSVRPHGVRVMALCPGYTRTEFHDRAGVNMSRTPGWLWLDADSVVAEGLRDLGRGKLVSVPSWKYKAAAVAMRYAPSGLTRAIARDGRNRIERPPT